MPALFSPLGEKTMVLSSVPVGTTRAARLWSLLLPPDRPKQEATASPVDEMMELALFLIRYHYSAWQRLSIPSHPTHPRHPTTGWPTSCYDLSLVSRIQRSLVHKSPKRDFPRIS